MSANRLLYALVAIALLAVVALTSWEALATKAVVRADHSTDRIEQIRLTRFQTSVEADHSHDRIEEIRASRSDSTRLGDRWFDPTEQPNPGSTGPGDRWFDPGQ